MIIYSRKCFCQSKEKSRLRELKQEFKYVEVRQVTKLKEWQTEADRYGAHMPFYVDGNLLHDFWTGEAL